MSSGMFSTVRLAITILTRVNPPALPNTVTLWVWGGGCEDGFISQRGVRVELETGAFAALTVTGGSSGSRPSSSCDAFVLPHTTPRSGVARRAGLAWRKALRSSACQPLEGAQEQGLGGPGTT